MFFQGNRLGNQIAKIVIEFIKSHINPDPAAAGVPLSAQIQSTRGFNAGSPSLSRGQGSRNQGQRNQGSQSLGGAQGQRNQGSQAFGGTQGRFPQRQRGGDQGQRNSFGGAPGQPQQSFDRSPPSQNFASQSIAGAPATGFGQPEPLRELPRRLPVATAAVAPAPASSGFVGGHHGILLKYLFGNSPLK